MKKIFSLTVLILTICNISMVAQRGELRTEINGFKWYCYQGIEAYSVDGKKLFETMFYDGKDRKIKISNIEYLVVDKDDKGVFIVTGKVKKCKYELKALFTPDGSYVKYYFTSKIKRISELFSNPERKMYYLCYDNIFGPNLDNDAGKSVLSNYDDDYLIWNNFFISKYDKNYEIIRCDNELIAFGVKSYEILKEPNMLVLTFKPYGLNQIVLLDFRGRRLTNDFRRKYVDDVSYKNGLVYLKDDEDIAIISKDGNWIISPKTYVRCREKEFDGKNFLLAEKNDKYYLMTTKGEDVLGGGYDWIDSAGEGYLKLRRDGKYGISTLEGKIIIPLNRGYDWIADYNPYDNSFYYVCGSVSGKCNIKGKEISREYNSTSSSVDRSSEKSSSSKTSSYNNSEKNTTTIVVEHHRDPVPMQEWQQCTSCWGSGNCRNCAGSGTNYVGSKLRRCSMCGGNGRCTTCSGKGGKYVIVYK